MTSAAKPHAQSMNVRGGTRPMAEALNIVGFKSIFEAID